MMIMMMMWARGKGLVDDDVSSSCIISRIRCASGCVVECRTCNREVVGSNLIWGYFTPPQPSIPPGSVNEYQLQLGR